MPLYDRRCKTCEHKEQDLYEHSYTELIECPSCKQLTFVVQFSAPHLAPDGLYSFMDQLDRSRQSATEGHGNASYRM